jgi:hypothetical protein
MQLKNQTARGAKMLEMNGDTYALRKNVMDVIYRAKKLVDIPRIEVRIVETRPCNMGYAYLGKNIIHIGTKYASKQGNMLDSLVLHEIVHAVKAAKHDEKCPLMMANYKEFSDAIVWDAFKKYF